MSPQHTVFEAAFHPTIVPLDDPVGQFLDSLDGVPPASCCIGIPPRPYGVVHDARYVNRWFDAIVNALTHPAEVRFVEGLRGVHVLGQAVFVRSADGTLTSYLWELKDGSLALDEAHPSQVVLEGVPRGWIWLDRFRRLFATQLMQRHAESADARGAVQQYAAWVFGCFRNRFRRGVLLRFMRQRVAEALALDAVALQLGRRAAFHCPPNNHVRLVDYNKVVANRSAFETLAREAPRLVTPFAQFSSELDENEEPAAALRTLLLRAHVTPAAWRLLHQHGVRRLAPLLEFYSCPESEALIDLLRILAALKPSQMPPTWLVRSVLHRFGNFGQRRESYLKALEPLVPALRRLVMLAERAGSAETAQMKESIYQVVSWLSDDERAARHAYAPKASWRWFLRRSSEWQTREAERAKADAMPWPAPFASITLDHHTVVPLNTRLALLEEGRLMRHCAGSLASDCASGRSLLFSIRRPNRERPVATFRLDRKDSHWIVKQVAGCANTIAPPHIAEIARQTADQINRSRWSSKAETSSERRAIPQLPAADNADDEQELTEWSILLSGCRPEDLLVSSALDGLTLDADQHGALDLWFENAYHNDGLQIQSSATLVEHDQVASQIAAWSAEPADFADFAELNGLASGGRLMRLRRGAKPSAEELLRAARERLYSMIEGTSADHDYIGTAFTYCIEDSAGRKAVGLGIVWGYSFTGIRVKRLGEFATAEDAAAMSRDRGWLEVPTQEMLSAVLSGASLEAASSKSICSREENK